MRERNAVILGIFVLLGTIAYGVFQWNERSALLLEADALSTEIANLNTLSKQLTEDYQVIKVEVSAERETSEQEIDLVFPTEEDLTNLTRLFDDFSVKNNFESNPFFISNITYQKSVTSDDGAYRYVPITLAVESSKKNLSKFLEYVESSGSLEGEVRLMSVEDMTLTYPDEYGGMYEARLTLYAYFSQEL